MWVHIIVFITTFLFMEFMAWFSHKYIMHGFMWYFHADHHKKDHTSWFERNDAFFIIYAVISIGFFLLWQLNILNIGLAIGLGIFVYGVSYFIVHDILFINDLNYLETLTIGMLVLCVEPIKCIINI
jgi:beta-carotene 3-hydroxylase